MASEKQLSSYFIQTQWRNRLAQLLSHVSADFPSSAINVGKRLQELRVLRGSSLRALAEFSRLNVNTLSMIKNKKTSPNVCTLQQIVNALNIPITTFFRPLIAKKDMVFHKTGKRTHINFPLGIFMGLGGGHGRRTSGDKGLGRGMGGGTKPCSGPTRNCVCPKCGYKMEHQIGQHCLDIACPKCGTALVRD